MKMPMLKEIIQAAKSSVISLKRANSQGVKNCVLGSKVDIPFSGTSYF
jgi:hypothetical protein